LIKTNEETRNKRMFLNIIKEICDKPIGQYYTKNGEQLKPFPLKSGVRQERLLSSLVFNIVLEFLARAIREEQERKWIQIGKEEGKISLFEDDMILYKRP
jgi:hypothetical protein